MNYIIKYKYFSNIIDENIPGKMLSYFLNPIKYFLRFSLKILGSLKTFIFVFFLAFF